MRMSDGWRVVSGGWGVTAATRPARFARIVAARHGAAAAGSGAGARVTAVARVFRRLARVSVHQSRTRFTFAPRIALRLASFAHDGGDRSSHSRRTAPPVP